MHAESGLRSPRLARMLRELLDPGSGVGGTVSSHGSVPRARMARPVQRLLALMIAERHGRVDGGRRGARRGRAWAYALAVGGVIASLSGCFGSSPTPTPQPTPTPAPTPPPILGITSPEDGDVVRTPSVQVVGTAPAGAEIVQQIALFGDRRTSADAKGDWVLTVDLEEGDNDLVFRIGDDEASTKTLRIVYEPEG